MERRHPGVTIDNYNVGLPKKITDAAGEPVWISGYELKSWRLNEGYRKVSFSKGRNRVLYRIENGHGASAFSLLISTKNSG